jgi:hypothetical protein
VQISLNDPMLYAVTCLRGRWNELETGYAFRFPGTDTWKAKIEEFVATERQCCSFFRIELTYEPNLGPIWLGLSGPEGTKQFIAATF